MPIIHLIVKHKNSTLFDEGIPVDDDITIEHLFSTIIIDILEPELWDEEFEAYFGNTKFGNKEKARKTCKVYEAYVYMVFLWKLELLVIWITIMENNLLEEMHLIC